MRRAFSTRPRATVSSRQASRPLPSLVTERAPSGASESRRLRTRGKVGEELRANVIVRRGPGIAVGSAATRSSSLVVASSAFPQVPSKTMQKAKVEIEEIVHSFVEQVVALVESQTMERLQSAVSSVLGGAAVSHKATPAARPAPASEPAAKRRKLNLSPEAVAVRKIQGQYMGLLRGLPATKRARVKKVAQTQGAAAAIKFAATLK